MTGFESRRFARQSVFISYRHSELYLKRLVVEALHRDGWETIGDDALNKQADARREIHKGLSKLLDKSLFVMPIITAEWLASAETRDELVRAHERGKCIVPLVTSKLSKDEILPQLPFFMRDVSWFAFDENTIGDVAAKSLSERDVVLAQRRDAVLAHVRHLVETITNPDLEPRDMQVRHSESILNRAKAVIQRVWVKSSDLELHTPVSHEEAFLSVAAPYFQGADSIDAVSLSRVSTFWVTAPNKAATQIYRDAHAKGALARDASVRRLFVFRNVGELFDYRDELDRHLDAYGNSDKSAVLVTSEHHYRQVLEQWGDTQPHYPRIHSLHEDFGVLRAGDDSYIATLDGDTYRIQAVRLGTPGDVLKSRFVAFMDECAAGAYPSVIRWSKYLPSEIVELGASLFTNEPGPILHVVLIDMDGTLLERPDAQKEHAPVSEDRPLRENAVRQVIDSIAGNFQSRFEELGISDFRVLDNPCFTEMTDGLYRGRLTIASRFDFGVAVTFEDVAALRRYYGHAIHAEERRRLYCALNPNVEKLYDKADGARKSPKNNDKVRGIFEEIEHEMRRWILRIDLHEDCSATRLVLRSTPSKPPPTPGRGASGTRRATNGRALRLTRKLRRNDRR